MEAPPEPQNLVFDCSSGLGILDFDPDHEQKGVKGLGELSKSFGCRFMCYRLRDK
jgi:hypothetical protein